MVPGRAWGWKERARGWRATPQYRENQSPNRPARHPTRETPALDQQPTPNQEEPVPLPRQQEPAPPHQQRRHLRWRVEDQPQWHPQRHLHRHCPQPARGHYLDCRQTVPDWPQPVQDCRQTLQNRPQPVQDCRQTLQGWPQPVQDCRQMVQGWPQWYSRQCPEWTVTAPGPPSVPDDLMTTPQGQRHYRCPARQTTDYWAIRQTVQGHSRRGCGSRAHPSIPIGRESTLHKGYFLSFWGRSRIAIHSSAPVFAAR